MKKKTYITAKGQVLSEPKKEPPTQKELIAKQAYKYKLYRELIAKYGSFENINKELIKRGKKPLKQRPQPPTQYSGGEIPILPPIPIPGIQIAPTATDNIRNIQQEIDEMEDLEDEGPRVDIPSNETPEETRARQEYERNETEEMRKERQAQAEERNEKRQIEEEKQNILDNKKESVYNKKTIIQNIILELLNGSYGVFPIKGNDIGNVKNLIKKNINSGGMLRKLLSLLNHHDIFLDEYYSTANVKPIVNKILNSKDVDGFIYFLYEFIRDLGVDQYLPARPPRFRQSVAGESTQAGTINTNDPNFRSAIFAEFQRLGINPTDSERWWNAIQSAVSLVGAEVYGNLGPEGYEKSQTIKQKMFFDNAEAIIKRLQDNQPSGLNVYVDIPKIAKIIKDFFGSVKTAKKNMGTISSTIGALKDLASSDEPLIQFIPPPIIDNPRTPADVLNNEIAILHNEGVTVADAVKEAADILTQFEQRGPLTIANINQWVIEADDVLDESVDMGNEIPPLIPDYPDNDPDNDPDDDPDDPDRGNGDNPDEPRPRRIIRWFRIRRPDGTWLRINSAKLAKILAVASVTYGVVNNGYDFINKIINNIKSAKKNKDGDIGKRENEPTPNDDMEPGILPPRTNDGPKMPIGPSYLPNSVLNYVDVKDYAAELNKINKMIADSTTSPLTKQYLEQQKIKLTQFIDQQMPNAGALQMYNIPPQILNEFLTKNFVSTKSGILQPIELTQEYARLGQTDNIKKYNMMIDKLNKMSDRSSTTALYNESMALATMINETRETIKRGLTDPSLNPEIDKTKATKRATDINTILKQRQQYEESQARYKATASQLSQLITQKAPAAMIDQLYTQMSEEKAKFSNDKKAYDDSLKVYAYTDKFSTNLKNQGLEVPITNAQTAEKFNEIQQIEQAIIAKSQSDPKLSELHDDYEILVRKIKMENPDNDAYIDKRLIMARDLYKSWVGELPEITQINIPNLQQEETTIEGDDIDAVVKKIDENIDVRLTEGEGTLQADIYDPAEAKLFLSDDAEVKKQRESFFEYSKVQPGNGLGSMRDNVLRQHNARAYALQYSHKLNNAPIFNPTLGREYGNPLLPTNYTKGNPEIKQLINRAELSRPNTQTAIKRQPFMIPDIQSQHGKVQFEHDGPMQSIAQDKIFKPFGIPDKATTTNYLRNESYYSPEYHLAQYTAEPTPITEIRNNGFDKGLSGFKPSTSGNIIEYTPQKFTNFNFGLIQDGANPTRRQSQTSFKKPANIDIGLKDNNSKGKITGFNYLSQKNNNYNIGPRGQYNLAAAR